MKEKDDEMKKMQKDLDYHQHSADRSKDMEDLVHRFKLDMAELRMANQDLTTTNRNLAVRMEEVKVEAELERTGEMDNKI